jgi:hypothetical protein
MSFFRFIDVRICFAAFAGLATQNLISAFAIFVSTKPGLISVTVIESLL